VLCARRKAQCRWRTGRATRDIIEGGASCTGACARWAGQGPCAYQTEPLSSGGPVGDQAGLWLDMKRRCSASESHSTPSRALIESRPRTQITFTCFHHACAISATYCARHPDAISIRLVYASSHDARHLLAGISNPRSVENRCTRDFRGRLDSTRRERHAASGGA
jgi:hypothetical protein